MDKKIDPLLSGPQGALRNPFDMVAVFGHMVEIEPSELGLVRLLLHCPLEAPVKMIQSFADKDTATLFHSEKSQRFGAVARVALRKLVQMNHAQTLGDLAVPPGNQLEALRGDLMGFHAIRINDQWRIVFRWTGNGPEQVRIVDYH